MGIKGGSGMRLEEIAIIMIYLFILILIILRFLTREKGRVIRRFRIGKAMTIGNRQVQEDNYGICRSADGFMAVLADGMGKNYGGKISSQIAVDTMKDMFEQYHASENPVYFFRKSFP